MMICQKASSAPKQAGLRYAGGFFAQSTTAMMFACATIINVEMKNAAVAEVSRKSGRSHGNRPIARDIILELDKLDASAHDINSGYATHNLTRGRNSVVECQLPKLNVVSSNLIGRLPPTRLNASPGFSFVLILQGFTLADWQLAAKQHIP